MKIILSINILNKDGTLNENVPKDYIYIDRIDVRKKLIVELEQKNF